MLQLSTPGNGYERCGFLWFGADEDSAFSFVPLLYVGRYDRFFARLLFLSSIAGNESGQLLLVDNVCLHRSSAEIFNSPNVPPQMRGAVTEYANGGEIRSFSFDRREWPANLCSIFSSSKSLIIRNLYTRNRLSAFVLFAVVC